MYITDCETSLVNAEQIQTFTFHAWIRWQTSRRHHWLMTHWAARWETRDGSKSKVMWPKVSTYDTMRHLTLIHHKSTEEDSHQLFHLRQSPFLSINTTAGKYTQQSDKVNKHSQLSIFVNTINLAGRHKVHTTSLIMSTCLFSVSM